MMQDEALTWKRRHPILFMRVSIPALVPATKKKKKKYRPNTLKQTVKFEGTIKNFLQNLSREIFNLGKRKAANSTISFQ